MMSDNELGELLDENQRMKNQRKWVVLALALVVGGIAWNAWGHDAATASTETATPVRVSSARLQRTRPSPPVIPPDDTSAQDAAQDNPPAAPAPDNAGQAAEATPAAPVPSTSTTVIAGALSFGGGSSGGSNRYRRFYPYRGVYPYRGYPYRAPFRGGINRPAPFRSGFRAAPAPFRGGGFRSFGRGHR